MTVAEKLRLARDFAYTSDEEEELAQLFPPLSPDSAIFRGMLEGMAAFPHVKSPPQNACVQLLEQFAREALADYASGPIEGSKAAETAELAARLQYLIKNDVRLHGHWPITEHLHALESDARKIATKSGDPTTRVHDSVRANLTAKILVLQTAATGKKPTQYGNGRAAKLLLAAVNPVMQYARRVIGVEPALPLTGDMAVALIRQYVSGELTT